MRNLLAVIVVFAVCFLGTGHAQSQRARVTRVSALPETAEVLKAFRVMASKTASGMNVQDYGREVGDLKVAVDALDEALVQRREDTIREQLAAAFLPYQQAKEVWGLCTSIVGECGFGIIALGLPDEAAVKYTVLLLAAYPRLNAPADTGGVLMNGGGPGRIHYGRLLSGLWDIGEERARTLRTTLQAASR